jgi:REP element-mobilizing transposase RayT
MRTYHVWFSTKYRREALQGEVGEAVASSLGDIALRSGIDLLEMALAFDHVHMIIAIGPDRT